MTGENEQTMGVGMAGALFPRLEARSLTGRSYILPGDFEGGINAVLVAFWPWQQVRVDTWVPALESLTDQRPDLQVYEVAAISRAYRLSRPFIDGGMVAGIPDANVRARTLTAYTNIPRILASLGLPDTSDIGLFVVDRDGGVLWSARGGCDPERADSLAQAL